MEKITTAINTAINRRAKYLFHKGYYNDVAFWIDRYPKLPEHKIEKLIKLWYQPYLIAYSDSIYLSAKIRNQLSEYLKEKPIEEVFKKINRLN